MGSNGILVADWGAQGVTDPAGGPLDAPVRVLSDEQRLRVCALLGGGGGGGAGACQPRDGRRRLQQLACSIPLDAPSSPSPLRHPLLLRRHAVSLRLAARACSGALGAGARCVCAAW